MRCQIQDVRNCIGGDVFYGPKTVALHSVCAHYLADGGLRLVLKNKTSG